MVTIKKSFSHVSANILLLAFLYLIQGLPYGFQSRFMPIYLRSQGVSLTNVGLFKLLLVPWLCKTLWAPLVDQRGTKHGWLMGSVFGLVVTCAIASIIPPNNMFLICIIMFMLNVCAATQDIAVDGIAVSILTADELGHGNVAQVVGYKFGSIIGGGLLVWFLDVLGWMGLFLALTAVYFEALIFIKMVPGFKAIGVKSNAAKKLILSDTQSGNPSDLQDKQLKCDNKSKQSEITTLQSNKGKTQKNDSMHHELLNTDYAGGMKQSDCNQDNSDSDNTQPAQCKSCTEIKNGSEISDSHKIITKDHKLNSSKDDSSFIESTEIRQKEPVKCDCEKRLKARKERQVRRDQIRQKSAFIGSHGDEKDVRLPVDFLSRLPTKFDFLKEVFAVPGTKWMTVYVLIYKLGEQGAVGMLPLFLLDRDIPRTDVTFWTGVVGQGVSILGSLLGGYILSNYGLPCHMVLQQLSLCRLMPLGGLLWLISVWTLQGIAASTDLLFWGGVIGMTVLLFISGMITTVTFTLMMQCSQLAPSHIQATHYTTLATFEVFGKLTFMSVVGWLVDSCGYGPMYFIFILLSLALIPWLNICPKVLVQKVKSS